jgi:peptidoglycan/LPS O-acetylase OafA/YrhL
VYWIFFCVGSPGSGVAYTYIILASVYSIGDIGRVLSSILSWRVWYIISQLGFAVYLIHPVIYEQYIRDIWIMPTPLTATGVIIYSAISLIVVITASLLLYVIIERPLEAWLRRVGDHLLALKSFVRLYVIILLGNTTHQSNELML